MGVRRDQKDTESRKGGEGDRQAALARPHSSQSEGALSPTVLTYCAVDGVSFFTGVVRPEAVPRRIHRGVVPLAPSPPPQRQDLRRRARLPARMALIIRRPRSIRREERRTEGGCAECGAEGAGEEDGAEAGGEYCVCAVEDAGVEGVGGGEGHAG